MSDQQASAPVRSEQYDSDGDDSVDSIVVVEEADVDASNPSVIDYIRSFAVQFERERERESDDAAGAIPADDDDESVDRECAVAVAHRTRSHRIAAMRATNGRARSTLRPAMRPMRKCRAKRRTASEV